MSDSPDRDALAAEYALGCLQDDDLRQAEALMRGDPGFARAVASWQARLAPLARLADPIAPSPDLWARIEAATAPAANDNLIPRRRLRVWQAATGLSLAIAASLALFLVVRQPEPARLAVLAPLSGGGTPVLVATAERGGGLTVRPNGAIAVPSDRDLELWALAKGETRPRSLGVLPATGRHLVATLAPETQLLVSLEPLGGSPTGQPTGPVLYGGTLTAVN